MTRRSSWITAREWRLAAALFVGGVVTGLESGVTGAPLANLAVGLLLGVPAGLAVWCALTVAHQIAGAR